MKEPSRAVNRVESEFPGDGFFSANHSAVFCMDHQVSGFSQTAV